MTIHIGDIVKVFLKNKPEYCLMGNPGQWVDATVCEIMPNYTQRGNMLVVCLAPGLFTIVPESEVENPDADQLVQS